MGDVSRDPSLIVRDRITQSGVWYRIRPDMVIGGFKPKTLYPKRSTKKSDNYGEHLFEIYRNTVLGLDESIKKVWQIIDSPRTDSKERIKAIILLKECYDQRLDIIRSEPSLIQDKKYMDRQKMAAPL